MIMYADKITNSMRRTIDETERRREKQMAYNEEHGIIPTAIVKSIDAIMGQTSVVDHKDPEVYYENTEASLAADPVIQYMSAKEIKLAIDANKKNGCGSCPSPA